MEVRIVQGWKAIPLAMMMVVGIGDLAYGQTAVTIYDSSGNRADGTINAAGNVFFHDNNGNIEFGTIKDGNVFLNSSSGQTTFGVVRNGNVFLTDQKGNTTGTIRNGNIFLSNSDGSITTGSYNNLGGTTTITTNTTPAPVTTSVAVEQPSPPASQTQQSESYQEGYATGQLIGTAIAVRIQVHRLRSFCKKNPSGYWRFPNGSTVTCSAVNARR
jgi:hypothetical protein